MILIKMIRYIKGLKKRLNLNFKPKEKGGNLNMQSENKVVMLIGR